ncbi:MAG: TIGR04076 family protein [Clostridia bacterium]
MFQETKVILRVKSSMCDKYKIGDEIFIDGPFLDKERTKAEICFTAISAIYPFIYGVRKGLTNEAIGFDPLEFQCPDCPDTVVFEIIREN